MFESSWSGFAVFIYSQYVPRYYYTKLQVQALTVGVRNKLVIKISWIMLKSQVKDRLTLQLKGEGKISEGQDFDCGRSSPYSVYLGDTPRVCRRLQVQVCTAREHCSYHCMQPPCDMYCNLAADSHPKLFHFYIQQLSNTICFSLSRGNHILICVNCTLACV